MKAPPPPPATPPPPPLHREGMVEGINVCAGCNCRWDCIPETYGVREIRPLVDKLN